MIARGASCIVLGRWPLAAWAGPPSTPWRPRLATFAADFDGDGDVDGEDFLTWQANFGLMEGAGDYNLTISVPGQNPIEKSFTLKEGEPNYWQVKLDEGS